MRSKHGIRSRSLWLALVASSLGAGACGWDPGRPFDRDAPAVKRALTDLDAGDAATAAETLETYLATGACDDGKIGAPDLVKQRPNGAYDLGLALFKIGEQFGKRFGDEEEGVAEDPRKPLRAAQIECALRIVRAALQDTSQPIELRSRARYLEGNLLFLGGRYEEAVTAYDESLRLSPGFVDAGDPIARDAAYNRAIALKRIDDKKDAGQDAAQDSPSDGQSEGGGDSGGGGNDAGKDSGGGGRDAGTDGGGKNDNGDDAGRDAGSQQPPQGEDAAAPPPKANQDDRILDQLENAPTVQQESAKKNAQRRRVRGMADK
jgi:tetratricopeptide (TPR) repeat protein